MSDSIITVENLSKKYIISHKKQEHYTAMRDVLVNGVKGFGKKLLGKGEKSKIKEEFWALKDINFEIKQGDRVGIIGRNGAGKSTLLKILSRITEPTTGKIHLRGRVASLLEVGTGFHPELTGRENIFLNGAIMGMSKWEIQKKFDEIVDFAEVEKFLDTPVKRYSSGMYVRLAFAVAAHLEPEILVVDEVLAVGDTQFQKKCLGKMEEVGKEGRTVLFVSHNMNMINKLCNKVIYLENGRFVSQGDKSRIIRQYLAKESTSAIHEIEWNKIEGHKKLVLTDFSVVRGPDSLKPAVFSKCKFRLSVVAKEEISQLSISIRVSDFFGSKLFNCSSKMGSNEFDRFKGEALIFCEIDKLPLLPGKYLISIKVMDANGLVFYIKDNLSFSVSDENFSKFDYYPSETSGKFLLDHSWKLEKGVTL